MTKEHLKPHKPTDKIKLILLPPKVKEEVTDKDVQNFYKNLIAILLSED